MKSITDLRRLLSDPAYMDKVSQSAHKVSLSKSTVDEISHRVKLLRATSPSNHDH